MEKEQSEKILRVTDQIKSLIGTCCGILIFVVGIALWDTQKKIAELKTKVENNHALIIEIREAVSRLEWAQSPQNPFSKASPATTTTTLPGH
jgi:hypothetical protein